GVRFDRFYCAASPCLPSRAAWFTGQYGRRNGVVSNTGCGQEFRVRSRQRRRGDPVNGDVIRVPEMFSRHLRAGGMETVTVSNFADRHAANWFLYGWSETHSVNLKGGRETAAEVGDAALRWLRVNARRDRWLLHVNFWDAHRCYRVDPSWADRFRGLPGPDWPDEETISRHQALTARFSAHGQFPGHVSPFPLMPGAIRSRHDFEQAVTGYDAAIACVDHHVGLLLDELRRQGVYDDCAVIVTVDHGDSFGERGVYTDHVSADECIHRIPLIVRWPGVSPGVSDALLSNIDLYPTVSEMLGLATPEEVDGRSFAPLLRGGCAGPRDHLIWECGGSYRFYMVQRAVRTERHLLIETYDRGDYPADPVELYDMCADPHQQCNLVARLTEVAATLQARLTDWRTQMAASREADPLEQVLRERAGGA
ncbi:MAG TPA: sulfatase-like hydrolase/transferase, partial [Phycisphaerae bacterium]|nr:sulfatase-like hydrolase/transferase [Phycisphaerae bacterium]